MRNVIGIIQAFAEKGAVGINRMKLHPNRDLGYDADKEGEDYEDYLDRNGY